MTETNQDEKEGKLPYIDVIFKPEWHRWRGDGRIATERGNLYYRQGDASRVIARQKKRDDYNSGGIRNIHAVFVDDKVYGFPDSSPKYEIDIVKPSDLENMLSQVVALETEEGLVVIRSKPLRVRGKPYKARPHHIVSLFL